MAPTYTDYAQRAKQTGLNIYFVSQGDRNGNLRTDCIVPANPTCNCYSIAKAFTVTAIGMLFDRRRLTPDTRIADVLGDLIPADADPKWQSVTLHHLMLHCAGFDKTGLLDIDAADATQFGRDYLQTVFQSPLAHEPGTVRVYTDAAYYLLSRVVERLAGMDLAAFLRPVLMNVMQFREMAWSTCPMGYSMGATGLYLRTEDTVKLGILYLRGGDWMGTRVISKEWVDTVLANGYEFSEKGNGWYGKGGMRGQMLAFHPARGLAVAWNAYESKIPFEEIVGE